MLEAGALWSHDLENGQAHVAASYGRGEKVDTEYVYVRGIINRKLDRIIGHEFGPQICFGSNITARRKPRVEQYT